MEVRTVWKMLCNVKDTTKFKPKKNAIFELEETHNIFTISLHFMSSGNMIILSCEYFFYVLLENENFQEDMLLKRSSLDNIKIWHPLNIIP